MIAVGQIVRKPDLSPVRPISSTAGSPLLDAALAYGRAKSEQDLEAAVACITADFALSMPCLGARAVGVPGFREAMRRFYVSFPDYRFVPEAIVGDQTCVALSGRIQATFSAKTDSPGTAGLSVLRALGIIRPRVISVPAVAMFIGRGDRLSHETFHVDGIALADALHVPSWMIARMRRAGLRGGSLR